MKCIQVCLAVALFSVGLSLFGWAITDHAYKEGRKIGYSECIEAINSITYRTPNETYNAGAEAMKSSAIAQIGCYREERK